MMWWAWDGGWHALAAVRGRINVAWDGGSPLPDTHAIKNFLENQNKIDKTVSP